MKCRRCKKDFEFDKEHRPILAMSPKYNLYNPNQLCKDCRPFNKRGLGD
jgi:hypothetical protein